MNISLRKRIGRVKRYCVTTLKNGASVVRVYNDMPYLGYRNHWLRRFCESRGITKMLESSGKTLSFIGIHDNSAWTIKHHRSDFKVFTTWENIHVDNWGRRCEYNYFKSNTEVDFSLGFDYGDDERYLRFPYWLISCFPPDASLETIRQIVDKTNARKDVVFRDKFCAFICRLDYFGDRAEFADIVGQIDDISFPSGFRHNDDALKQEFKDNKNEYLKQFRFNLCPENANDYGYVTEKIFDSFNAGCIPLYWGGGGRPETEIISKDVYVYVDKGDKDNLSSALSFIRELNENENLYKEFVSRPVYMPDAADIVYGYYIRLENKLKGLLK